MKKVRRTLCALVIGGLAFPTALLLFVFSPSTNTEAEALYVAQKSGGANDRDKSGGGNSDGSSGGRDGRQRDSGNDSGTQDKSKGGGSADGGGKTKVG